MDIHSLISDNKQVWDEVAEDFFDASALPEWGPFGVGTDLNLIPEIQGKTFIEIGCGSGRSLKYLVKNGAKHILGIDLSETQLTEANRFNQEAVTKGIVELHQQPMEVKLPTTPVDYVISIYALGWTQDPRQTLANIYSYLKPGGMFIWSWDHSFFSDIDYAEGKYIVQRSYHKEGTTALNNWKKSGAVAHIAYRKTATWFRLQKKAGFDVVGYYEPSPINMERGQTDPTRYYAIQKAELAPCTMIFHCQKPR